MTRIHKILLVVDIIALVFFITYIYNTEKQISKEEFNYNMQVYRHSKEAVELNKMLKYEQDEADFNNEMFLQAEELIAELDGIEDNMERYKRIKELYDVYSDFIDPPENIYDYYTDEEVDLLCKVVQAECGPRYGFDSQARVAMVILNRIESDLFPNTMEGVLNANQFVTVSNGAYKKQKIDEQTRLACEYAFEYGMEEVKDCLFFDSNGVLNYTKVYSDNAMNYYKKGK